MQNLKEAQCKGGFTIIEMLIYVVIVSMLGVLVVGVLVSLSGSYARLKVTQSINESAITALNRMTLEIRQAYGVDVATSTFGVDPGNLGLDTRDEMENSIKVAFTLSDGQIRVFEEGIDAGALTRSDVTVKNLMFEHVVGGISEAIQIFMVIESAVGNITKEEAFQAAAVLRGTYGP